MKEELVDLIRGVEDPPHAQNRAREYLQARILLAMQEAGAMIPLAFQGGTALRFLYGLPRFSEDLDFALERPERSDFDIAKLAKRVIDRFRREGYRVEKKEKTGRVVEHLMVIFPGLPRELGFSPHASQRLRIRIEVDTRPPKGAGLTTTIVRRHALLNLQHHDRASLLSGKLHAVLQREWTKGRDLFDLFWYLSDHTWPEPNFPLLNNALRQTGWEGSLLEEETWKPLIRDHVATLDWRAAEQDVAPFLEPGPHVELFGRESTLALLT